MAYIVNASEDFKGWFDQQEEDLQNRIASAVGLLEEHGP